MLYYVVMCVEYYCSKYFNWKYYGVKFLKMDLHQTEGYPALFSSGILNPLSHSQMYSFKKKKKKKSPPQILARLIGNKNKLFTIVNYW